MATYTVDASVFINAFNPREEGQRESHGLLAWMQQEAIPIIVPTLLFVELAAAVARGRKDPELARRFAEAVARLPHLVPVALDKPLARQAAAMAAEHRLRGSDAVYAAVARRFGSILVTRDLEQRQRVAGVLTAMAPGEARDGH